MPHPATTTPDTAPATPPRPALLTLGFAAGVLALSLFDTPHERLTRFLYNDSGAELTVPKLLARGLRPTVDFGYIYGLLPLLVGKLWYGIFGGPGPAAFRLATL